MREALKLPHHHLRVSLMSKYQSPIANVYLDRLPTVSASAALQRLRDAAPNNISTGLPTLNTILAGQKRNHVSSGSKTGGLVPGQIIDVYGPPGVGKTAFWYVLASAYICVHILPR